MRTGVIRHVRPARPGASPRPAVRSRFPSQRLAALVLVPALLSGCSAIPGFAPDAIGGAESGTDPGGPSWLVATRGSATPSPKPSRGTAAPTPGAAGFLPLAAARATNTPTPTCSPNSFNFSRIAGAGVTPASRTAVVSWYNVGGYNLVEFRLYAISQDLVDGAQRDVGFVTVRPTTSCGQMSATIINLSPKTAYVFSVDAVVLRKSGDGTYAATVARSYPIRTK